MHPRKMRRNPVRPWSLLCVLLRSAAENQRQNHDGRKPRQTQDDASDSSGEEVIAEHAFANDQSLEQQDVCDTYLAPAWMRATDWPFSLTQTSKNSPGKTHGYSHVSD